MLVLLSVGDTLGTCRSLYFFNQFFPPYQKFLARSLKSKRDSCQVSCKNLTSFLRESWENFHDFLTFPALSLQEPHVVPARILHGPCKNLPENLRRTFKIFEHFMHGPCKNHAWFMRESHIVHVRIVHGPCKNLIQFLVRIFRRIKKKVG